MNRSERRRHAETAVRIATAVLLLAALTALLAAPAAVMAGGVGKWTNVTGKTGSNLTQVDIGRRPDGRLGVAWVRRTPSALTQDVMFRTISTGGANGPLQTVQSSWATLNNPAYLVSNDLVAEGIFHSGIRSTSPGETHSGLSMSLSTFASPGWLLLPAVIDNAASGSSAYAWDIEAAGTTGSAGYYFTWSGANGVRVHGTVSNALPDWIHNAGQGSFGYYSSLGYDKAANALWVAWASNSSSHPGLWVSLVDQTAGAPAGVRYLLPKSVTSWGGGAQFAMMMSKVPATGRPKGSGVYVAYPTGYPTTRTVRLWKVMTAAGDRRTMVVAGGTAAKGRATVAAAPDGRVWVVWSQKYGGRSKVLVRRSNTAVTEFGPTKAHITPAGYAAVHHLAAAVRGGKLDVLVHASGSKPAATLHIQFKPPG